VDRDYAAGLLHRVARAEDRGLDLEDVLRRLDDDQVGAALEQAAGLLGEDRAQLGEGDLAQRRVVAGGQMARGANRAGYEATFAGRLAGDLGCPAVDLERVLVEAPLLELDAAALERVGLEDVGAGLEHRAVDALDDVGAVEHERLVALALETAVVLLREVELLERRAHAAVVDDNTLAYGFQVVPHPN